ncbi:gastrula zinc finger protein XlCGF7.1-like [Palaemon carinicauda]|uniref:gastrula zinc finger protein XlCGF7.1-like n=1 Tax=Palaemon carinicauda TaxID=392227 RepID=UPI0035B68654
MMDGTAENVTKESVDGNGTNSRNSPPVELVRPDVIRCYGVTNRFLVTLEPRPKRSSRQQQPKPECKQDEDVLAKADPKPHCSYQEPQDNFDFEMFAPTSNTCTDESHTQKRLEPIRKKHRCLQCNYSAHKKSNLNRHEFTHLKRRSNPIKNPTRNGNPKNNNSKKRFCCPRCNYKFQDKTSLNKHELSHVGVVKYCCDVCSYSTKWKHNLDRHKQRVHVDSNKPIKCEWCKASFTNKYGLAVHSRIHTSEKPGDSNQ